MPISFEPYNLQHAWMIGPSDHDVIYILHYC
jgi:hypothetical protein